MVAFGNQVRQYFDQVHARIENPKFTVEKQDEGIQVEIQLKAYIHPKPADASTIIRK